MYEEVANLVVSMLDGSVELRDQRRRFHFISYMPLGTAWNPGYPSKSEKSVISLKSKCNLFAPLPPKRLGTPLTRNQPKLLNTVYTFKCITSVFP